MRSNAAILGVTLDNGKDGWLYSLCYPWDQHTSGMADPLEVRLKDLEQRLVTEAKVQLWLPTTHAKMFNHVLGLLNHALGQHFTRIEKSGLRTGSSGPIKYLVGYILPALQHSWMGRKN